jgi:hypothetical protein
MGAVGGRVYSTEWNKRSQPAVERARSTTESCTQRAASRPRDIGPSSCEDLRADGRLGVGPILEQCVSANSTSHRGNSALKIERVNTDSGRDVIRRPFTLHPQKPIARLTTAEDSGGTPRKLLLTWNGLPQVGTITYNNKLEIKIQCAPHTIHIFSSDRFGHHEYGRHCHRL